MTDPVTPTPISPLPPAPLVTDSAVQFDAKAFPFAAALDTLRSQINMAAGQTNTNAVSAAESAALAQDGADAASSNAAYKGPWSQLTGALQIPASVSHNGTRWVLLQNVPNVAAVEPGVSSAWELARPLPFHEKAWNQLTANGSVPIPDGVSMVRIYALGKGADGSVSASGGGGSMGFGSLAVSRGDVLQATFSAGTVVVSRSGVTLCTGSAAVGSAGGIAVANHASVTNGGSYSGGAGASGGEAGGGGAGSPLGVGGASLLNAGGGGGGMAGAGATGGGGCGYAAASSFGGGSGGASSAGQPGIGRHPSNAYTDPLLVFANGGGGGPGQTAANGGGGGGYATSITSVGNGGFGGGGGGAGSAARGGNGGFGGGGGRGSAGGNGGHGGGGGAGSFAAGVSGVGGAAIAMFYF